MTDRQRATFFANATSVVIFQAAGVNAGDYRQLEARGFTWELIGGGPYVKVTCPGETIADAIELKLRLLHDRHTREGAFGMFVNSACAESRARTSARRPRAPCRAPSPRRSPERPLPMRPPPPPSAGSRVPS